MRHYRHSEAIPEDSDRGTPRALSAQSTLKLG
jgi:hypothetical protein